MLLYAIRQVQCTPCGVKAERVPWAMGNGQWAMGDGRWAMGKHSLTKAYMLYFART